jgi:hypothetical protein
VAALRQIIGAAVYICLYVRVTKSGLRHLLYIRGHDIALVKKQIAALTPIQTAISISADKVID